MLIPGHDQSPLPPPGDARRDALKARHDGLEQQAEETATAQDLHRADPAAFRVDNEIAQHFDELAVSHQDPAHVYCWVNSSLQGRFVKMKMAEGWEVVQGEMPEAVELRGMAADSTRRIGDVILMRIQRDRHLLLQRAERKKRMRRQEGVTANLVEMGERLRDRGVIVHTDVEANPRLMERLAKRSTARSAANRLTDTWMRQGRMPGAPAPGR